MLTKSNNFFLNNPVLSELNCWCALQFLIHSATDVFESRISSCNISEVADGISLITLCFVLFCFYSAFDNSEFCLHHPVAAVWLIFAYQTQVEDHKHANEKPLAQNPELFAIQRLLPLSVIGRAEMFFNWPALKQKINCRFLNAKRRRTENQLVQTSCCVSSPLKGQN